MSMSREDDFDDIMDSPDEMDLGQDDTSEVLIDENPESPADEPLEAEIDTIVVIEEDEMPEPVAAASKPAKKKPAKKKIAKKVAKKKTAAKPKAKKKKAAKPSRKPA